MGDRSTERLVVALQEANAPPGLVFRALSSAFHDYKSDACLKEAYGAPSVGERATPVGEDLCPLNLRERVAEVIESMTRVGYQYQAEVTAGVVLCVIAGEIEAGAYDGMTEIGTWLRTEAER